MLKLLTFLFAVALFVGSGFVADSGPVAVHADDDGGDAGVEFLACRATADPSNAGFPDCDLTTGVATNDLVSTPPTGTLAVLEPDTVEHTATWESAPSAAPVTLLPGQVTLDLVMMNHFENNPGSNDICWSKHVIMPDGTELTVVGGHCFENPLPETPGVCSFGAQPPSAACIALADLVSETVTSEILTPTVIPAGSVTELSIFCPGSSFLGIFFNDGLDVDGDGVLEYSKLTEPVLEIEIDIKPGSDPNSIDTGGRGLIPVAILTTDDFDATTVDPDTVQFGPAGASKVHRSAHVEDVDNDGDLDLVLHFRTQETGIASGDTEACLTFETFDGAAFQACDSVRTVPTT